jgi:hypothetical protein
VESDRGRGLALPLLPFADPGPDFRRHGGDHLQAKKALGAIIAVAELFVGVPEGCVAPRDFADSIAQVPVRSVTFEEEGDTRQVADAQVFIEGDLRRLLDRRRARPTKNFLAIVVASFVGSGV